MRGLGRVEPRTRRNKTCYYSENDLAVTRVSVKSESEKYRALYVLDSIFFLQENIKALVLQPLFNRSKQYSRDNYALLLCAAGNNIATPNGGSCVQDKYLNKLLRPHNFSIIHIKLLNFLKDKYNIDLHQLI